MHIYRKIFIYCVFMAVMSPAHEIKRGCEMFDFLGDMDMR